MDSQSSRRLPVWRKLGYAVGGLGDSLAFNVVSYYLMYYLINVAGIPPIDAGVLAGLPRVLLAPLGALAGPLSDRLHSKWGRRRVLLLIGGPVTGGCFFLQFYAPPGWGDSTLIAYWWIVQVILNVALTLTLMAYHAMAAEVTPGSRERLQLVSLQQGFGVIGGIVGPSITFLLVDVLGGRQSGFNGMSSIYGLVIALTFVTVFLTTPPEREAAERRSQPPLRAEMASVLRQRPFLLQLLVAFLVGAATVIFNALVVFYVTFVLLMEDLLPMIILVASVSSLAAILGWNWMSKWSTRWAFTLGILLFVCALLTTSVIPTKSPFIWILSALIGVGSITTAIYPKALLTDVIAHDQIQIGRSRSGLYTGVHGASTRIGSAFGSALVGWLLAEIGFAEGATQGLRWIIRFVPTTFLVAIIPCILLFHLSPNTRKGERDVQKWTKDHWSTRSPTSILPGRNEQRDAASECQRIPAPASPPSHTRNHHPHAPRITGSGQVR
jgi:Na+/melibiose symporter-like transporter